LHAVPLPFAVERSSSLGQLAILRWRSDKIRAAMIVLARHLRLFRQERRKLHSASAISEVPDRAPAITSRNTEHKTGGLCKTD
jgi:hypothetical protein